MDPAADGRTAEQNTTSHLVYRNCATQTIEKFCLTVKFYQKRILMKIWPPPLDKIWKSCIINAVKILESEGVLPTVPRR